jgi:hypothetical protein
MSEVAKRRHETLERVLEALGMEHMRIPSTKVDPILTEAFYLEILEGLATRMVALEALAKRADGHAEILGAMSARVDAQARSIDAQPESIDASTRSEKP